MKHNITEQEINDRMDEVLQDFKEHHVAVALENYPAPTGIPSRVYMLEFGSLYDRNIVLNIDLDKLRLNVIKEITYEKIEEARQRDLNIINNKYKKRLEERGNYLSVKLAHSCIWAFFMYILFLIIFFVL